MKNQEIREKASASGVFLWEIAEALGLADNQFSRKLRHEFNAAEKEKIFAIIDGIAAERGVEND